MEVTEVEDTRRIEVEMPLEHASRILQMSTNQRIRVSSYTTGHGVFVRGFLAGVLYDEGESLIQLSADDWHIQLKGNAATIDADGALRIGEFTVLVDVVLDAVDS